MRDLLSEIERARRARGWTARQTSVKAVGTPELIRDMRRGRVPSVVRFRALCEVLGLEFYVGTKRSAGAVDPRRLERALETADRGLATSGREMDYPDRARVVAAIYDLIGHQHEPASAERVIDLIEAIADSRRGDALGRRE